MRAFQGAFHNNPDYALWYGWSEMVQDLTGIRTLARDLRENAGRHFQNKRIPADHACYTCHSDYTMFGDVDDKIRTIGLICVSSSTVPDHA